MRRFERATEARWADDAFTCRALQHGIEFLISHFGPREALAVPPSVKGAAAEMPPALAKRYSSAKGVGVTETGRVITWIETWIFNDFDVSRRDLKNQLKTLTSPMNGANIGGSCKIWGPAGNVPKEQRINRNEGPHPRTIPRPLGYRP